MAPPASAGGAALKLPGASSFPSLDERLAQPETREEVLRGERVLAQPALAPHGDLHFGLDYVLGAHVSPGFIGSTDLLTRAAHDSDFATDTCIRRAGDDPGTGTRYLEEVAFEVVHAQPLKKATERAEDWSRRGVRRIFGVFVKKGTVEEWVPKAKRWRALDPGGVVRDPCLLRPIAVKAVFDAGVADDEVARALEAKNNPVIVAIKAESEARGEQRGLAAAVLAVLANRGLAIPPRVREAIQRSEDLARLHRWLARAMVVATADEVLDEP